MNNCTRFLDDQCGNITHTEVKKENDEDYNPLAAILQIMVSVIILAMNLLVVLSIKRYKKLQTVSNIFRGYLALNDTFFGTLVMLRGILQLYRAFNRTMMCFLLNIFLTSSAGVTMSGVLLLWVEMFLLTRRKNVNKAFSKNTAYALIIVTLAIWLIYPCSFAWIYSEASTYKTCLISYGLAVTYKHHFIGLCFVMLFHLIVLLILQCLTFRNLRRHVENLKKCGIIPQKSKGHIRSRVRQTKVSPLNNDINLEKKTNVTGQTSKSYFSIESLSSRLAFPASGHSTSSSRLDDHTPRLPVPAPGCSTSTTKLDNLASKLTDPSPGCSSTSSTTRSGSLTSLFPEPTPGISTSSTRLDDLAPKLADPTPGCFNYRGVVGKNKVHQSNVQSNESESQNKVSYQWSMNMSKVAKLIRIILLSFVICYVPYFVCLFLSTTKTMVVNTKINYMTGTILMLNSLTNPIVYLTRNKDYRKAFKHILLCKKGPVPCD